MVQKLYVGNLPSSVTRDDLLSLFSPYGDVNSVSVITDRDTGCPRGFAFVEMENTQEAVAASESLHGHEFEGRALKVNVARERQGGSGWRTLALVKRPPVG